MKICFISTYPPDKEGLGFYTQKLFDYYRQNKDDQVSVITFRSNTYSKDENIYRVLTLRLSDIRKTYMTLNEIKPDIIHVQFAISTFQLTSFVLWGMLAKYKNYSRTKCVATLHEIKKELNYLGLFGVIYYKLVSRVLDNIFVLTEESKNMLGKKCKINKKIIKVIPHGIFPFKKTQEQADEVINKYCLNKFKTILFFGYIHVDKGIQYLIKAYEKFFNDNPKISIDTQLLIIGTVRPRQGVFRIFEVIDKLYYFKLKRLANSCNSKNNINFFGFIHNDHLAYLLKSINLVVLPYVRVEQSGVLNNVLRANKPIIASRIGGFADTLKDSGILVPPRDVASLSEAITLIMSDESVGKRLIMSYQNILKHQDFSIICSQVYSDYLKLLSTL